MKPSESDIEMTFKTRIMRIGGMCLKFVSPGNNGVPDRLVLLPHGITAFVELKAPGEEPRPLQKHWLKSLERLGYLTYVIDSKQRAIDVSNELRRLLEDVSEQI